MDDPLQQNGGNTKENNSPFDMLMVCHCQKDFCLKYNNEADQLLPNSIKYKVNNQPLATFPFH